MSWRDILSGLFAFVAPAAAPTLKPEPLKIAKDGSGRFVISDDLLVQLRKTEATAAAAETPFNPFKLPKFPPGVAPKDGPKLAMDQASGFEAMFSWASSVMGLLSQGMGFLGFPLLAEMSQRPEYRSIVEIIASEMTRKWIEFQATGKEDKTDKIKQLEDEIKRFKVRELFNAVSAHDGFFGRAHIYIDTGDTDNPAELKTAIGTGRDAESKNKLAKDKLVAFRTVEAYWVYPLNYGTQDPLKDDWYKPQTWLALGKEVHRTRLLTFVGREVPDMLKPAYAFGGQSMTQIMKETVENWLETRKGINKIINSFSTFVLATDMASALNTMSADTEFLKRLDLFNLARDNRGVFAINKATEEFTNVSAPLGTLDGLQSQAQEHMCSLPRIPVVKLLGIQPSGMNATSEGEIETFEDAINAVQETFYRPHLTTIIDFIQINLWGKIDPEITFKFMPLGEESRLEAANRRKVEAETATVHIANHALTPEEERQRIAADKDTPYDGLEVDKAPPLLPGEKADVAQKIAAAVSQLFSEAVFSKPAALKTIKETSDVTGIGRQISAEDISDAEAEPPAPSARELMETSKQQPNDEAGPDKGGARRG